MDQFEFVVSLAYMMDVIQNGPFSTDIFDILVEGIA